MIEDPEIKQLYNQFGNDMLSGEKLKASYCIGLSSLFHCHQISPVFLLCVSGLVCIIIVTYSDTLDLGLVKSFDLWASIIFLYLFIH